MPLLEGPIIHENGGAAKPPLQFTLNLPLLGGAYFGRIFCFKDQSKNRKNEIVHAELVYLPLLTIYIQGLPGLQENANINNRENEE